MTDAAVAPKPRYDLVGAMHDYPPWRGRPRRSILICSHQRSGSTMLGEALYFAGGLGCPLEYLHAGFRPGFEARWGVEGLGPLAREMWRRRTDPSGTLSAKLFWYDVAELAEQLAPGRFPCLKSVPTAEVSPETYRKLDALLREVFPDPVHVHLERRDRLRQAISWFVAVRTNSWRKIPLVEGDSIDDPVDYDFEAIGGLMATTLFCHAHWRAFFAANAATPHEVTYEELVADYAATVDVLLNRLGSTAAAPAVRMERQSTARSESLMRRFLHDQSAARRR